MGWITTKLLGYVLGAVLLAGAGYAGWLHFQLARAEKAAAEATRTAQDAITERDLYRGSYEAEKRAGEALVKQAKVDRETTQQRIAVAEAQRKQWKKKHDDLAKSLNDHTDWSTAPIPDGVRCILDETCPSGSDEGTTGTAPGRTPG